MSQTPAMSAVEAATNLDVGFGLAIGLQAALFPVLGLTVTPVQSLKLGGAFTMASLLRSYLLRRVFERLARGRRP